MNSYNAEVKTKSMLKELGYKFIVPPSPEKLISIAIRLFPNRVANVIENLEEEGINLADLSSWDIIDTVYGLDVIVYNPNTDEVIGIDVTLHPHTSHKFHNKKKKQEKLQPLYKAIGVNKTLVYSFTTQKLEELL